VSGSDPVATYLRWVWWRALLHRGWWLVTSVYLVVDAGLTAAQLVLIGAAQGATALVFEVPAGVLADTVGRRWSLVVSHALMGTAMAATGLTTDFVPIVATQMLWGLSWTFASGADVAFITDELADPERIAAVLARSARAGLTGAAAGLIGLGALASLTQRRPAMVAAGAAMLLCGLYVAVRFRERRFVPAPARRWSASWTILVRGSALVRGSRAILLMFGATLLVNTAAASARLHQRRLVDIGFPARPLVWFTVLGILTLLVGAGVMRAVESRLTDEPPALRGYRAAALAGAAGVAGLAVAPGPFSGGAAVLLVSGVALPLTRTIGTIWVNRQTSDDVRATVHSFLAQAEYAGAIVGGLGLAALAGSAGLSMTLVVCGVLFASTVVLLRPTGAGRTAGSGPTVSRSGW
jgi:MFS family permease